MHIELLIALVGCACVVVGISGRGVRFWHVAMPPTQSPGSRAALIGFGLVLVAWGLLSHHGGES